MKALDIGTIAPGATGVSPVRRRKHGQNARVTHVLAVVVAALACSVSLCGVAEAASGALHRGAGAGLKMEVDTRWPSGAGYRPVRITVTPVAPAIADRTLTVELAARHFWNRGGDDLRVVQDIEIPAGSGAIRTTMSVPQTLGWNQYKVTVIENGKVIPRLSYTGSGDQYTSWVWEEKFPKVLIVGDKLPDTSGMGALLNVTDYYQYGSAARPERRLCLRRWQPRPPTSPRGGSTTRTWIWSACRSTNWPAWRGSGRRCSGRFSNGLPRAGISWCTGWVGTGAGSPSWSRSPASCPDRRAPLATPQPAAGPSPKRGCSADSFAASGRT